MIDLSIVIVNWNTSQFLRQCLESVFATVHLLRCEVWVVDNGSTDDSLAIIRSEFHHVRLIENHENQGFARANNLAIKQCSGRYVLFLNSDAFLKPGSATALVSALEADNTAGIAGAHLEYLDGKPQWSYGRLPNLAGEVLSILGLIKWNPWFNKTSSSKKIRGAGLVSGACMMVRRDTLDQIGLFDERFFMFSEEVDLCKRAQMGGWRILYVPESQVVHVGGGSSGLSVSRILRLYTSKLQYFEKHSGEQSARILWLVMWAAVRFKSVWYAILGNNERKNLWRGVARVFPATYSGHG